MHFHDHQGDPLDCLIERTAGIDWWRAILTRPADVRAARDVAHHIQDLDRARGGRIKPWSFVGYKGYASTSLRWGERGLNLLWETSGTEAHSTSARLASLPGRVTRVDLQTTWTFSRPVLRFGSCLTKPSPQPTSPTRSPRRSTGLVKRSTGYWCSTVGDRTDPDFWRCYDKGNEDGSAPNGHKWRLELEAKYHLAPKVAEVACASRDETPSLWRQLGSWWARAGYSWPEPVSSKPLPPAKRPRGGDSPAFMKALWLQTTVRPTIPQMIEAFGVAGVLELLGLDGLAIPTPPNDA